MYKILIVDDDPDLLQITKIGLHSVGQFEILTASNGAEALTSLQNNSPHLVLLDVNMPSMDGIECVKQIKKINRKTLILMHSSIQDENLTLDALFYGAEDFLIKGSCSLVQMVEKINALLPSSHSKQSLPSKKKLSILHKYKTIRPRFSKVNIMTIGASTGGPEALLEIIQNLPEKFDTPLLICLHLPKNFTSCLVDRLNQITHLEVVKAKQGDRIRRGKVYMAPGDYHMIVEDPLMPSIRLTKSQPVNFCRPAVDVLFDYLVSIYKESIYEREN